MLTRFNVYAIGVALALGAWAYIQTERLEDSRAALEAEKLVSKTLSSNLAAERKTAQEQASSREQYLSDLEKANVEINTLSAALDDSNKRLRIKASCTKLPESGSNGSRTEAAYAELDQSARRSYLDLRRGIITLEARHKLCVSELERIYRLFSVDPS